MPPTTAKLSDLGKKKKNPKQTKKQDTVKFEYKINVGNDFSVYIKIYLEYTHTI